jgi:hypothetical protein
MSFNTRQFSPGVLLPEELAIIERVYNSIAGEAWFTDDEEKRNAFAAFLIKSYHRGLIDPEKLFRFCSSVAKWKFNKPVSEASPARTTPSR